ncbi:hypothetical protein EOL67_13910 [Pseudomonas syringae pv. syringae]|nr:hypothetical protein EOL67_13910 [Pseudomonas syringae pv. syringae]
MSSTQMNHISYASEILLTPHGLDVTDLQRAFSCIHEHRIDYADVYLQSVKEEQWSMENGVVKSGSYSVDQGFGLRAIHSDETAFAYSQLINAKQLMSAVQSVRSVAAHGNANVSLNAPISKREGLYGYADPLQACEAEEKIALLQSIDTKARAYDPRVTQGHGPSGIKPFCRHGNAK